MIIDPPQDLILLIHYIKNQLILLIFITNDITYLLFNIRISPIHSKRLFLSPYLPISNP